MTLFLIALAVGVVSAVVLWKIGQRRVDPQSPGPLVSLVGLVPAVIWALIFGSQVYDSWSELTDVAQALRGDAAQDLGKLALQIEAARIDLAVWSACLAVALAYFVKTFADVIKAFMRRAPEASAKPQETLA